MSEDQTSVSGWTETERLLALHRYGILDSGRDARFDDIVDDVRRACDVPIALVSLVDAERQWFKAKRGVEVDETPLDTSVCAIAIRHDDLLLIPDLTLDARTTGMSLVTGDARLRFYAGAPMTDSNGARLGSVCAIDTKPRAEGLTESQRIALTALARQAALIIELDAARRREGDARHTSALAADDAASARMPEALAPVAPGDEAAAQDERILDSAVDHAFVATDLDGRVTRWSAGAERLFGWSASEMEGASIERIFTVDDVARGRAQREMRDALTRGHANDERWHVRRDGVRFWASGEMLPLHAPDGATAGFVKVVTDRTRERRREQRLLLLSKAAGGLLVARNPDEVLDPLFKESAVALDIDQAYHYAAVGDATQLRLTHAVGGNGRSNGSSSAAPACEPLCRLVAARRAPLLIDDLQATDDPAGEDARRDGVRAFAGYPIEDGAAFYGVISFATWSSRPFDAESLRFFATLARLLAIVRTRLTQHERILAQNVGLKAEVDARTAALAASEEHLRQSLKMEAVGQLTGGIAHDFNNMLAAMSGSLEMLQRRVSQSRYDEIDRYVAAAQASVRRAAGLTHRLLAFSRRQTLDPQSTSPPQLITGIVDLIQRTVGPAAVLGTAIDADCWHVRVDRNQLENALLNLCINARDAMPDGGTITLSARNRSIGADRATPETLAAGDYVEIGVADTGAGMSPEVMERAFDPFFTTKPMGEGTGLGLSMVYGFARQSGGLVQIASTIDIGTTVAMLLPRHDGTHELEARTLPHGGGEQAIDGFTVLVVDDEASIRMLVCDALRDVGCAALEASDASSALRALDSGVRIDLLISDVGLAGTLNGRQLAEMARMTRPDLKVLFVTGYAEGMVMRRGALASGMEILTKPFAIDTLVDRARKLLDAGSTDASSLPPASGNDER